VREFFERWPGRFPRRPRTTSTNVDRLERWVFPFLPRQGDFPLPELKRSVLREVMAALLARGLSKGTIDGTFASLSGCFRTRSTTKSSTRTRRACRVKVNDPRLEQKLPPRDRRAVPPAEVGAFMACMARRRARMDVA
jgi:hypothetical protein